MAWWDIMHPSLLGMDYEDEEMEKNYEGYLDEEPYQVDNPMHKIPMQGASTMQAPRPALGLVTLPEAMPLVEVGNIHVHLLYF